MTCEYCSTNPRAEFLCPWCKRRRRLQMLIGFGYLAGVIALALLVWYAL